MSGREVGRWEGVGWVDGELKVGYTLHWNRDRIVVPSKVNCSAKTGCAQKEAY